MLDIKIFNTKFLHLEKAIISLQKSIIFTKKNEGSEYFSLYRDSVIQRFEYCYELSWKFMKYVLEKYNLEIETRSPKQVLKSSFKVGYIDNLELWFKISEFRNKTSHEYQEDIADDLYYNILDFFGEMQRFYEFIKIKKNEGYFTEDN